MSQRFNSIESVVTDIDLKAEAAIRSILRAESPYDIRGEELAGFLNQQQNGMRRKCAPNEFFCFRCRVPREACLGIADVSIESPTRLRVTALCAVCETRVNKIQRVRDLPKIEARFNVQELTGEHLIERSDPRLNSDLEG